MCNQCDREPLGDLRNSCPRNKWNTSGTLLHLTRLTRLHDALEKEAMLLRVVPLQGLKMGLPSRGQIDFQDQQLLCSVQLLDVIWILDAIHFVFNDSLPSS